MLEPLGISALEESIYRVLLREPRISRSRLRELLDGVAPADLRDAVAALEQKGLVTRTPGRAPRFAPAPPDLAIGALVERRKAEAIMLESIAAQLAEEFRAVAPRDPLDFIEVLSGSEAVNERRVQLERSARREVRALSAPPYATTSLVDQDEREAIARGVSARVIYTREALDIPGLVESLRIDAEFGEESRVLDSVPVKLLLIDDDVGMMPIGGGEQIGGGILIHRSPLLDGLVSLFEMLWSRAMPLFSRQVVRTEDRSGPDRALLAMLLTGLTDEAIARRLGISSRSVRRRVSASFEILGATNRFQAGYLAARHGYLQPEELPGE